MKRIPLVARHVWPLLLISAAGLPAQAAEAESSALQTIVRFSGETGTTAGASAWSEPLWNPADGRLYGVTRAGGEQYDYLAYGMSLPVRSGRGYTVVPDGSGYASWSLGSNGGIPLTNAVLDAQGRAVAAGQFARRGDDGPTIAGFRLFGVQSDGLHWFVRPTEAQMSAAADVSPRGTLARDAKGNIYFGLGSAQNCNATNPDRSLYRLSPAGALDAIVDFCDFSDQVSGTARSYRKGGAPFINFYSQSDQALYILSTLAAQNGAAQYPDIVSGTDTVAGFLVRIRQAALDRGNPGEEDIELLRVFKRSETGGVIGVANDVGRSALVESGEWLYGTGPEMIWRLKKSDPQNSFAVVHRFPSSSAVIADGSAPEGVKPMGGLVRAHDGNIYGVTSLDTSVRLSNGRAAGAGSLYRVVVGQEADRRDDRVEFLHYFNAETEGKEPAGLSAGPASGGKQQLYGAAGSGLDGFGGLFRYEIDVPQVAITQFAVSAPTGVVGESLRLDWQTEHASQCVAGGSNGGIWSGVQQTAAQGVPVTLVQAGANTFSLECEDEAGQKASASLQVQVEEKPGQPGNPGSPGESGGGGGGPVAPGLLGVLALGLLRRYQAGIRRA